MLQRAAKRRQALQKRQEQHESQRRQQKQQQQQQQRNKDTLLQKLAEAENCTVDELQERMLSAKQMQDQPELARLQQVVVRLQQ